MRTAVRTDGSLRPDYLDRMQRVLDAADRLGMVPIVGYFYFGQSGRLEGEEAVIRFPPAMWWPLRILF